MTKEGRKIQPISFSKEEGYKALEWLQKQKEEKGGMSAYITRLILEDKEKRQKNGEE
jgi:hypothetical protein